jgi:protein-tyrosine-phosphatase
MVEVARKAKVDLSGWSSHRITAEMVAASDTILVMEHRHYERLTQAYPEAAEKTFLLGMAGAIGGRGEIDDPFGKQRLEYERCAREVIGSVHRLLEILPTSDTSTI